MMLHRHGRHWRCSSALSLFLLLSCDGASNSTRTGSESHFACEEDADCPDGRCENDRCIFDEDTADAAATSAESDEASEGVATETDPDGVSSGAPSTTEAPADETRADAGITQEDTDPLSSEGSDDAGEPTSAIETDLPAEDAGVAGVDDLRPTTCAPSTTSGEGAVGCFCQGAVVVSGDTLYRQSYGIEVFDVSTPAAPTLLRTIPETGVSDGDLVVMNGYLISATNIFPTLNVYSLEDASTPDPVGSMMLPASSEGFPTGTDLAERNGVLAVAYWDSENASVIQILSIDSAGNLSIDRTLTLEGQITSLTLAEGVAHILIEVGPNLASHQELQQIDLADGTVVATFNTASASVNGRQVREWRGDSFLVGTPALSAVHWTGTSGSVVARWEDPDILSPRSLEFIAPGLLALGSGGGGIEGRVSILDVFDAESPQLLGFGEAFRVEHLAVGNSVVYASGNDALDAIATACE